MYFEVNNSGCSVRKGMVQVRYDMLLDEGEHRYNEYFLNLDDKMQNTPFLCHFCQFEPSVTDEEILFVGELVCDVAYKEWKEDKPHGVRNLPVDFSLELTLGRKTTCEFRLAGIKRAKLEKKLMRKV